MSAQLIEVRYKINSLQVICVVEFTCQNSNLFVEIAIEESALSSINPDWWLEECVKQASLISGLEIALKR